MYAIFLLSLFFNVEDKEGYKENIDLCSEDLSNEESKGPFGHLVSRHLVECNSDDELT